MNPEENNESGFDSGQRYLYDHWWLDYDKDFAAWLEFVDSEGKSDAYPYRH
jgi:hypothetical protein